MPGRFTTTLVAVLGAGWSTLVSAQTKSYTLQGSDVAVYNLVGTMTVEPGKGPGVQVEVTLAGADAGKLTVDLSQVRGRPALRVNYPDDHIVYPVMGRHSNSDFEINDDGTWSNDGHRGRRIYVRGSGDGLEAHADLVVRVPASQRVGVFLGVGKTDVSGVNALLNVEAESGDVRLSRTAGTLHVETGSGNVEARDGAGSLKIETGSGDVKLFTFSGTSLKVDTGSGNVDGSGLTSPDLSIDTGSGDISLTAIASPDVDLDTGSGNVTMEITSEVESLKAETGSGDVKLRVPDSLGAEIRLGTGSGDFRVDFPMQLTKKEEGKLLGRVGDGKGLVSVETGSGNVTLSH
jgi:lia operon protein LiaG